MDNQQPLPEITPELVREGLRRIEALIKYPAHWTSGENARDAEQRACFAWDRKAVSWCLIGAAQRIACDLVGRSPERADKNARGAYNNIKGALLIPLAQLAYGESVSWGAAISRYNDSHSHNEVLALVRRAREAA